MLFDTGKENKEVSYTKEKYKSCENKSVKHV